ncbi:sugar phosphate nucleotidyltransferase, partial [Escherichia albertii]
MNGVILAAGVGSRLRPITSNKPKCLVKVAGIPILEYQLNAYRQAGINNIYIIVGYEGEKIRNYCKYIKDLNITIVENDEYETTNNMYSL